MRLESLALVTWCVLGGGGAAGYVDDDDETINNGQDSSVLSAEDILLKIFDATGGFRWNQRDEWIQSNDVCTYYGVTCYPSDHSEQQRVGHVQKIDLSDNHLVGTLPGAIFSLPFIESLDVRKNADLDVDFSEIDRALYLKVLVVSETAVRSLEGLEKATSLETLHITNLGLRTAFPSFIYQLKNLRVLYANYNSFTGTLSESLGDLYYLEELFLYDNEMNGRVPTSIGRLRNLKTLSIGQNAFSGSLPSELGDCSSLEVLAVHREKGQEKGQGLSGPLPSLSGLENIAEIYLQNQRISGSIPTNFLQYAPKDEQIKVDLRGNDIVGSIPTSLADKRRMNMYLMDNQISSLSSSFCSQVPGWMDGDVANVGCDAILCPAGTSADEGRATSLVSCETCSTANFMGSTACAAAPGESVDEEAVLVEVYNKMGGRYWQSANDWLTDVNHCQWEGITCENGSVTEISLSNRGLTGLPPDSLFLLPALRVLDLSSNSILFDFSSAARAKSLEVLDLSQCDLPYLTGIGDLSSSSLRKLSVASNDMRGMVPSGLFSISSLEELDISHNQFSGALSGIESLSNLVRFRCSGNNLSGPFPAAFGYLSGLVEIMAADNQFSGSLSSVAQPEAFIDLTGNRITSINDELCSRGSLMEGAVGVFSCNAILCPTGTFNEIGRQSSQSNPCRSCSTANYMGTKRCEGQVSSGEVDILRELYTTTYGDSWLNNAGWATSSDYCSWYGITCNSAGNVIKIDLEANNLMGEPSKSIFGLPSLAELNLSKNRISFQFAGIGEAQSLVTLKLSGLGLNSVDGIGEASALSELHLTDNDLTEVPGEILGLSNLRSLFLNFNRIEGRLSSDIGNLQSLEELYLFDNRMTGQLPASIGSLSKLRVLVLSENNFSGTLPPEMNSLEALEILAIQREGGIVESATKDVGFNQGPSEDDGTGLTGPLLPFDKLTRLQKLYLGVNSLSGTIPSNFLDGILDKRDNIEVDLISNRLTGDLPASLARFESLTIYVAGNEISGIPDGLCRQESWMNGAVGIYDCDGILCPPGFFSKYGRSADASSECSPCPSGTSAFYGSFVCSNEEETSRMDEREVLEELYRATSGHSWRMKDSWMDPDVSVCQWAGVSCTENGNVESIHLMRNGLTGQVPSSIYDLEYLKELNVAGNLEVEMTFDGIEAATRLEYINLDSTGLGSLAGIESASNLKLLHVADNRLDTFPLEVLLLTNLEVLYMSENNLGGSLPSEINALSNLVFFACSQCGFEGSMPSSVGQLTNLEFLELDQNEFYGSLPSTIQNLQRLKHLDLSRQLSNGQVVSLASQSSSTTEAGFEGPLPSFSNLTQLTELYLFTNRFSGEIPDEFMQYNGERGPVTVDLRRNRLSGTVPSSLSQYQSLNFYVSENMITGVPTELCSLSWNDKRSSVVDCDFILCAAGTFNGLGRATSDLPCESCTEAGYSAYMGSTSCGPDLERQILDELYRDLGGPQWTNSEGWADGGSVCSRYGVECDEKGLVRVLDLHNNNLFGIVSSRIWLLTRMRVLNLSQNHVDVTFDKIADAESLTGLSLSQTNLRSIDHIGNATSLLYLDVSNNAIPGPIPVGVYELTKLERLYLHHNDFSGSLSTLIGNLVGLKELQLTGNDLSGSLPDELAGLMQIKVLLLGQNKFTGSIPQHFSYYPWIEVLNLEAESVASDSLFAVASGLIGTLPPFHSTPRLRELHLGSNALGGTIPSNFLAGVREKSSTIKIDIRDNNIEGSIPETLGTFSDLRLDAANNFITEIPSEICAQTSWMNGLLAEGCDALLCPPGTFNDYGKRLASEECHSCDHRGVALYYGSTQCGAILPELMTEKEILEEFFSGAGGPGWKQKGNWLDDSVSVCQWYGIECEQGIEGQDVVTAIRLPSNDLEGYVSSIVFHLPYLRSLDVSQNDVNLSFRDIKYAKLLENLNVSSTIVTSLDDIGQATNLRSLALSGNSFYGQYLPDELFELTSLVELDISGCGFFGTLPSSVGSLSLLQIFDASGNALDGELPSSLGRLSNATTLLLSENEFFGVIPPTLGSLTSIEVLKISARSRNGAGLSGPIPSFSDLSSLRVLDLGGNSLTGEIPSDFLATAQTEVKVTVLLDGNMISGEVPSSLARFESLNLDLRDNEVEGIGEELCDMSLWWEGDVGRFNCMGLLCPIGTFNAKGRQSLEGGRCEECPGDSDPFMGRTFCPALEKTRAREILVKFFEATDGHKWKNSDGWLSEGDICDWHGVTCSGDYEIESLVLGGNNVGGQPPKEIFELPGLKYLWLYSNPIDMSFDGIENAVSLRSIQLDSTGLSSLTGIGKAPALVDLDVRFNALSGSLSPEIAMLTNLETLFCGDNKLDGTLPSFASNRKLTALRCGGNDFRGQLPPLDVHPNLKTLSLPDCQLTGSIPHNLLDSADKSKPILIDLSSNNLSGTLPAALSRFDDMTLYFRDNNIEGIAPELCMKEEWNGGDVGVFGCDGILCPPMSASSNGRASEGKSDCHVCGEAKFFGSTGCVEQRAASSSISHFERSISALLAAFTAMAFLLI